MPQLQIDCSLTIVGSIPCDRNFSMILTPWGVMVFSQAVGAEVDWVKPAGKYKEQGCHGALKHLRCI